MVTYNELENSNFYIRGLSNKPITGKCVKCGVLFEYSTIKRFLRNRKNKTEKKQLWQSCQKCWLAINTSEDENWIKKQSESQKIAQNRPGQKIKNAKGVSKSWTDKRKKEASEYLRNRWQEDKAFRKKAMLNLNADINQVKIGFGKSGLKGEYNNIKYDSALELSFIMWCNNKNIPIKRYDLEPVDYIDENDVARKYYPDFIINNNEIVEIKGNGSWYNKHFERNIRKILAARERFDSFYIIFEKDEAVKKYYNIARKRHNETYIKKNC